MTKRCSKKEGQTLTKISSKNEGQTLTSRPNRLPILLSMALAMLLSGCAIFGDLGDIADRCGVCGKRLAMGYPIEVPCFNGRFSLLCKTCNRAHLSCERCHAHLSDVRWDMEGSVLCDSCWSQGFICDECKRWFFEGAAEDGLCQRCKRVRCERHETLEYWNLVGLNDTVESPEAYDLIVAMVEDYYSRTIVGELPEWELFVLDAAAFDSVCEVRELGKVAGFASRRGGQESVYIKKGLGLTQFKMVLAHELMHVHQHRMGLNGWEETCLEGAAQLGGWLILNETPNFSERMAEQIRRYMMRNKDYEYGVNFRRLLEVYEGMVDVDDIGYCGGWESVWHYLRWDEVNESKK